MSAVRFIPAILVLCSALAACHEKKPVVGGDVDSHGCRPSAGYTWCEATAQCERPWELAASKGFENTPEAFDAFCRKK